MVALVVITAVTLLQLLIANSDTTGALGAVASIWLAVHQVPTSIAGHQLAALPLLPVLLMVWGTARATARAVGAGVVVRYPLGGGLGGRRSDADGSDRPGGDSRRFVGHHRVADPERCAPLRSSFAVHGIGALIGLVRVRGVARRQALKLPGWAPDAALRAAVAGVMALLGLSGVAAAGSLVVHWGTMHQL